MLEKAGSARKRVTEGLEWAKTVSSRLEATDSQKERAAFFKAFKKHLMDQVVFFWNNELINKDLAAVLVYTGVFQRIYLSDFLFAEDSDFRNRLQRLELVIALAIENMFLEELHRLAKPLIQEFFSELNILLGTNSKNSYTLLDALAKKLQFLQANISDFNLLFRKDAISKTVAR